MDKLNLHERTILHLSKFHNMAMSDDIIAPLELTQDGISMALGISRNHTSVILSKMQRNDEVGFSISRIRYSESGIRRKAYFLTPKGLESCDRIMAKIREEGMDEDTILIPSNVNYYSGEMMDAIPPHEMDVIGMTAVLRVQVDKAQLPQPVPRNMPFDGSGRVFLKPETRARILTRANEALTRRWHSLAADWCADNCPDVRERLYHLIGSGRTIEAERIAVRNMYVLMDNPARELVPGLLSLAESSESPDMAYTVAMISIRTGMMQEARRAIERIRETDDALGDAMESELELVRGDGERALKLALRAYRGDMETGLALGKSMVGSRRYKEALVFLRRSMEDMRERRCVFRMDEALRAEAEALGRIGDEEGRERLEDMADSLTMRMGPEGEPPGRYRVSEDCVLL